MSLFLSDFESSTEFNRFRRLQGFPQAKRLKSYPAVKVCRLGVGQSMKSQGAGTMLLNFVKTFFTVDNKAGCRFITVDVYVDAMPFYEKNGFSPLSSDDEEAKYTRAMYFDLNDIA